MSKQELNQMGSAKVYLVEKHGISFIEKQQVEQVEVAFYQHQAKPFNELGILVPELIDYDHQQNTLRIEYIPHSVNQEFLLEEPRVIEQLAKIHRLSPTSDGVYHPHQWTQPATSQALNTLKLDAKTERFFSQIQEQSGPLFNAKNLISGDTNAGNWGRRDNGDLVLFDWERFSTGHIAIDLAPLVKGMGTFEDYLGVAHTYTKTAKQGDASNLARTIAIAKTWMVVEVVNILVSRQNPQTSKYIDWFKQTLPKWAKDLSAQMTN